MITIALILLMLALPLGATYLAYRVGHRSGYELAQSREKPRRALDVANAKLAGRLEAWREMDDVIESMTGYSYTDDRQVH
jgi:hypothetical protein